MCWVRYFSGDSISISKLELYDIKSPVIIFIWHLRNALSKGIIKEGRIQQIKPVGNFMPRAFAPVSLIKVEIDNKIYSIYADLQEYEILRLTKHKSTLPFLCYKNKAFLVTIP